MPRQSRKIRYAVVGLGHIAQVAVLPAFAHARRNSQLTALVSDDETKRTTLGKRYRVAQTFSYDDYDACLREVDAVYIALPNSMHADYTIRAARAGVHVLCEKPMAVTVAECRRMIAACEQHGVKLMIAYRLHFESLNLAVIDLVRTGVIGEPKYFNSSFSMTVREGNIRTKNTLGGGSVYDIGVYCINAARYLFRGEPREVMALSVHSGVRKLKDVDETTGALLRFDNDRLAAFVTSFNAADAGAYRIVGTRGSIRVDPAYEYAEGLKCEIVVDGKTTKREVKKHDQFAPQLLYFSDCILQNRTPEPSGEEGMQDVRVAEAIYRSARRGTRVTLPAFTKTRRPTGRQRIVRPGVRKPKLVNVKSGHEE